MLDFRQSLINSTLKRVLKRLYYPLEELAEFKVSQVMCDLIAQDVGDFRLQGFKGGAMA